MLGPGRVPLFPLLLTRKGNATPTIPYKLRHLKGSGAFQFGTADAAAAEGRRGSNVYEVNPWLWQFGRGRPRIGGLSVSETTAKTALSGNTVRPTRRLIRKRHNSNKCS